MYVIAAFVTNGTGSSIDVEGRAIGANSTENIILPADRCTWQITQNTGDAGDGYSIHDVLFFNGHEDGAALETPAGITIDYRFGYIGKSGRFVELAN